MPYGQQKVYANFDPRNNPFIQRRMQDALLDQTRANADLAEYKVSETRPPLANAILGLGQILADRYNERGIYKGNGYLTDFFNNYGKPAPQVEGAINPQQGNAPSENLPAMDGVNGGAGIGGAIGQPSVKEQADLISKADYLGKFKDSNTANPNGDAIAVKNTVADLDKLGDQIDFSKVDRNTLYRQAEEMLKERGLTGYQRGQVLANFDNIYNEKLNRYNENKVTNLIAQGQAAVRQGKWDEAQNYFLSAGMINPRAGAMYMQGLNATYNRNMAERKIAMAGSRSPASGFGGLVPGVFGDAKNGYFALGDNGQAFATDAYGRYKPINIKIGGSRYSAQQNQAAQNMLKDVTLPEEKRQHYQAIVDDFVNAQAPVEYDIATPSGISNAIGAVHNMHFDTYQDELNEMYRLGLSNSPYWNRAHGSFDKRYYTKHETNNDFDDFDPNEKDVKLLQI